MSSECRARKLAYVFRLESVLRDLHKENEALRSTVESLSCKLKSGDDYIKELSSQIVAARAPWDVCSNTYTTVAK